jgi:hypothetical protein
VKSRANHHDQEHVKHEESDGNIIKEDRMALGPARVDWLPRRQPRPLAKLPSGPDSLFQRLLYPLRDGGRHLVQGEAHSTLESVWAGEQDPHAVTERVGGDPGFVRRGYVLATSDHRRLDALAPGGGDALGVQNGQRTARFLRRGFLMDFSRDTPFCLYNEVSYPGHTRSARYGCRHPQTRM